MKIVIDLPIDTHYHIIKKNISKVDIDIVLEAIRKCDVYNDTEQSDFYSNCNANMRDNTKNAGT